MMTADKLPSKGRGCDNKINLGRRYAQQAERLAAKHNKQFGVYKCPHCHGWHLTTKLEKRYNYTFDLVHITGAQRLSPSSSSELRNSTESTGTNVKPSE